MPNLLETFLPSAAFDQVAVFDQNFTQIFPAARAIKAVVKEEAKVMEHPLESGATIVDHRVILPVEVELSVIIGSDSYQDTYRVIKQYYLNSTLLIVQTQASVYYNMLISSMPHEENPDMYNAISVALTLKEALFFQTFVDFSPTNPKQSSEINRGNQQGQTLPNNSTTQSYLSGLVSRSII